MPNDQHSFERMMRVDVKIGGIAGDRLLVAAGSLWMLSRPTTTKTADLRSSYIFKVVPCLRSTTSMKRR